MADGILTPCNVRRSWHWFIQVTAPCNAAGGSGMTYRSIPQTSAILEFYFWFRLRPSPQSTYHSATVCEILSKSDHPRQKNDVMSILDFMGPIMGSLKSPYTTSYRASIDTIALNCLYSLWKNRIINFGVMIQDGWSPSSLIFGVQSWILWKAHVRLPSYRSSIDTIAVKIAYFWKMRFCILASSSNMADLRRLGFQWSRNAFFKKPMYDFL